MALITSKFTAVTSHAGRMRSHFLGSYTHEGYVGALWE